MKPILHASTAERFDTNGIGILTDTISARVVQELNGQYELVMKYPEGGLHAGSIGDRCVIMAKPDPVTDPQPFRVYHINPSSKGIVTVYARHLAYDLIGIPAAPFSAASAAQAMVQLKENAVAACPFSFTTDKSTGALMTSSVPKSIWSLLGGSAGSVLDTYGGEYEFDGYNVYLHNQRGADRGVSIRYGKNLKTLEQEKNCANCYTGVCPYWASSEGDLVQLPENIINAPGTYDYVRILTLDLSAEFQEKPTEDQLRERAEKYMAANDIGVPEVAWKVEFVQLEQTEEYTGMALLERVLLGDTVSVVFPRMNVNASARAVKIDFDPILERYNSVTLGKVKSNLATTIAKQQKDIQEKPSASLVQDIASKLASAMTGARGGAARLLDTDGDAFPDELYIGNHVDPAQATKVWRFNHEGFAASQNGYNGPFEMGATFDDGLLATFVTAAHLIAGTIRSKDGNFFVDLDNGIIDIKAVREVIDDLASYKEYMSTELEMLADGVTISVTKNISEQVTDGDNNLQEQINEITTNYRFTADGQYIGRTDDEAILRLAAGVVNVLVAGNVMATFDRTGMTAQQANIKVLNMGNFSLSVSDDGDVLTLA